MDLKDQNEVKKIIDGCIKGNNDDQKLLFKALYSQMMAICYRYANRSEDAKDLLQEGFIKVFDKIEKYNFEGSLAAWVKRIMVNNAIDYYRKQKKKFAFSDTYIEAENIPDSALEDESPFEVVSSKELMEMVQALPPAYRTVFNLFVMEDYSHGEIADELGISEGTSKSNLSKARRNLKKMVLTKLKRANVSKNT